MVDEMAVGWGDVAIGCLHLSALLINVVDKKGNLAVIWATLSCGCVAM